MRFELLFFETVDPSLGRVDHDSLPQQALMEMVIEGVKNKEKICVDVDEPKDIEEWKGVEIEDGEVAEIHWDRYRLKGSLYLEWLPSSVRKFSVVCNNLTGTLDMASLPISMENLNLAGNKFTGSIGLERLPARMESIRVFCNQLSGSYISDPMPSLSRSTWKDCQPGWRRLVMRENRLREQIFFFTITIYFEAVVSQEGT